MTTTCSGMPAGGPRWTDKILLTWRSAARQDRARSQGAEPMAETEKWIKVAARADLGDGEMIGVNAAGREIALYDVGGQVYATENICTHAFAMLTDGWLDGDEIECPLHGGRFNV